MQHIIIGAEILFFLIFSRPCRQGRINRRIDVYGHAPCPDQIALPDATRSRQRVFPLEQSALLFLCLMRMYA